MNLLLISGLTEWMKHSKLTKIDFEQNKQSWNIYSLTKLHCLINQQLLWLLTIDSSIYHYFWIFFIHLFPVSQMWIFVGFLSLLILSWMFLKTLTRSDKTVYLNTLSGALRDCNQNFFTCFLIFYGAKDSSVGKESNRSFNELFKKDSFSP